MLFQIPARVRRVLGAIFAVALLAVLFFAIRGARLPMANAQTPGPRPAAQPTQPQYRPQTQAPAPNVKTAPPAGAVQPGTATTGKPAAPAINPKEQKVMAVVNGEPISRDELAQECLRRYGKEVLEGTINRQLISQACADHKVQVTEQDIDQEIQRMAEKFKLSPERWLQLLQEERGFTPEEYRREVVWPMLAMRKLTASQLEITKYELHKAFEAEYGPRVRVRLIGVATKEKAVSLRAKAAANPDAFGNLSKEFSEDTGLASASGVVPPIRRNVADKAFEDAAFALRAGEISQPIQVGDKYYIIKCEDQLPRTIIQGPDLAFAEQQIKERLKEQKLRNVAGDMFQQMQKKAQLTNVLKDPQLQKQYPGVAAIVNGKQITLQHLGEECLARHGVEVLDGEINRRLLTQELKRKQQAVSDQDLDAEVARAAEMYGFVTQDKKPDVNAWLQDVLKDSGGTVELYKRDAVWPSVALKKLVGRVQVTDDDLKKGFESNYGEKVEVLAIVVHDQRQAHKVWENARNNPTDSFFGELAQQYSVEPVSRANGGKVPPIRRHGGQGEIEKVAFTLKAGELSPVIASGNQFIILRCLGRTKPLDVKFDVVKGEIYRDLEEQKTRLEMAKQFDRIRDAAQIDNYLAGTTQSGKRLSGSNPASNVPLPGGAEAPRTSSTSSAVKASPVSASRPVAPPVRK